MRKDINKTEELQKLMKKKKYEVQCSNCKATVITDNLPSWNKYGGFCKKCIDKTKEKIRVEVKQELKREITKEEKKRKEKEFKKVKTFEKKQRRSRITVKRIVITDAGFRKLKKGSVAVYDKTVEGHHINLVYYPEVFGVESGTLPFEIEEKCERCNGKGYVIKNKETGDIR